MIRILIVLAWCLFLAPPLVAAPRGSLSIGVLDSAALRLLHPDLRYRIGDFRLYLRPVSFKDPAEIALEASRRDERLAAEVRLAEAEIERLERRRLLIRRHIADIEEDAERARRNLKPEYARLYALTNPAERDEGLEKVRQQLRSIDDAAALRRGTGEAELQRVEESIRRARIKAFRINYLDGDEAASLEVMIRQEISQALDRICRRERIGTVVDVSALRPVDGPAEGNLVDRFWRTPVAHWPELFLIAQEETDFSVADVPEAVCDDFRFRCRQKLEALDRESWPRLDGFLLRGGRELTADVMDELLKQRGVDARRRELMVETLRDWRRQKGGGE